MIKRAIPGIVIGNMLEVYDLTICGLMAGYIAGHFFGSADHVHNVFNVFLLLCVGYIAKPFGGLFFGYIADTISRKKTLVYTIILISLSTMLIAFIPSYKSIGALSWVLFLFFRVTQGFAAGGEYMGSIVFLVEASETGREGFSGSWGAVGMNLGILLATFVVFIFSSFENGLSITAWRLALLLSLVGGAAGVFIRMKLPETLPFIREKLSTAPPSVLDVGKESWRVLKKEKYSLLAVMGLCWLGFCSSYLIFVYGPVHLSMINHLPILTSFKFNILSLVCIVCLIPIVGWLSDRYGRNIFLISAPILFLFFSYPYFMAIKQGNMGEILIFQMILSVAASMLYATLPVVIASSFPVSVRCTLSAIQYNIGSSLFGSTAPVVSMLLIGFLGTSLAPSMYLTFCSILGVLSSLYLKGRDHGPARSV